MASDVQVPVFARIESRGELGHARLSYKGQQLMWIASHPLPLAQVIKSLSALGMVAL
jgi:hypothetical protein